MTPAGEFEIVNRQILEYFGKTPQQLKDWATTDAIHPDDLLRVIEAWRRSSKQESRTTFSIGSVGQMASIAGSTCAVTRLLAPEGCIVRWYCWLLILRTGRKPTTSTGGRRRTPPDDGLPSRLLFMCCARWNCLYANQTVLDHTGLTLEDVQRED